MTVIGHQQESDPPRSTEMASRAEMTLDVLGGFELRRGDEAVPLAGPAQRLLAYLALQDRPASRTRTAGTLWPDRDEARAAASLRTALWRLRQPGSELVEILGDRLQVGRGIDVDVRRAQSTAWSIIDGGAVDHERVPDELLAGDVLPEWYDEWVLTEQQRFRQLRMHALEELCHAFAALGHTAGAVEVGLLAVSFDPLRESAQRALITAHLAEGNRSEAVRQYRRFSSDLDEALGISPSDALYQLALASG